MAWYGVEWDIIAVGKAVSCSQPGLVWVWVYVSYESQAGHNKCSTLDVLLIFVFEKTAIPYRCQLSRTSPWTLAFRDTAIFPRLEQLLQVTELSVSTKNAVDASNMWTLCSSIQYLRVRPKIERDHYHRLSITESQSTQIRMSSYHRSFRLRSTLIMCEMPLVSSRKRCQSWLPHPHSD